MKTTDPPARIELIGKAARGLLTPQSRGKVLAVVSHAAYLLGEHDEVSWLADEQVPLHRRCIRIPGTFPKLTVGSPFRVANGRLMIGPDTALDFSRAAIWEAPRLPLDCALPLADIPERLGAVNSILADLPAPAGFGSLVPGILLIAQGHRVFAPRQTPGSIPARAWPAVREIAAACLSHDFPRILEKAEALVGLGEGLTPSGDDFVGGLLFCWNILRSAYPSVQDLEFRALPDFINKFAGSTNIISYTFLKDHAAGHAMDTLHQFVTALLAGRPVDDLRRIISELIRIGHSTGWDLLTGVLTGMLLVLQ